MTDAEDPIVTTLTGTLTDLTGVAPRAEGVTYGADMRLLVNNGHIPTVLFGPGDVRVAHMPDEHVAVVDLEAAARALVVTAVRFCSAD